jgi:hypothetical protein
MEAAVQIEFAIVLILLAVIPCFGAKLGLYFLFLLFLPFLNLIEVYWCFSHLNSCKLLVFSFPENVFD